MLWRKVVYKTEFCVTWKSVQMLSHGLKAGLQIMLSLSLIAFIVDLNFNMADAKPEKKLLTRTTNKLSVKFWSLHYSFIPANYLNHYCIHSSSFLRCVNCTEISCIYRTVKTLCVPSLECLACEMLQREVSSCIPATHWGPDWCVADNWLNGLSLLKPGLCKTMDNYDILVVGPCAGLINRRWMKFTPNYACIRSNIIARKYENQGQWPAQSFTLGALGWNLTYSFFS